MICRRFNLIDPKETECLRDLEVALHLTDENPPSCGSDTASLSSSVASDQQQQQLLDSSAVNVICKQPLESVSLINSGNLHQHQAQMLAGSNEQATTAVPESSGCGRGDTSSDKDGDAFTTHSQPAA